MKKTFVLIVDENDDVMIVIAGLESQNKNWEPIEYCRAVNQFEAIATFKAMGLI